MFYYPAVLNHRTGCFSTVWLVATKGIRVPRRDFLKVNIRTTCEDIMNYVLVQVPPPRPGLPRPRFSLYLSSQLQYGVIVVYHRQCAIFLEELHSVVGQLLKQKTTQKIDMDEHSRQTLVFSDALSLLEETEGASDPLFGVMYGELAMPSPSRLIQMGDAYLREESPGLPEPTTSPVKAPKGSITASPDTITLREDEPVAMPTAEFEGVDLVDQHPDTVELLLAETDLHFLDGEEELPEEDVTPAEQEREGREADLDKERTKELTGSTLELQPTSLPSEDTMLLPQEEPRLSVEKPKSPTEQLTPVSVTIPPSPPSAAKERERPRLELEEVPSPELKTRTRKRKRQLIFFDPETQLTQEMLQRQIDDVQTETRRLHLFQPPSHRSLSAADLLNHPCTFRLEVADSFQLPHVQHPALRASHLWFLPEEVLFLWRRAATVTPVSGSDLQVSEREPESTESEKERESEMTEAAERLELSPKEVPRGLAEAEKFDVSGMGSVSLEVSDQRQMSRELSPLLTFDREGSVSRSVSTLQDIPEVVDELLESLAAESPGVLPELAEQKVLFHSLLSPETNRRSVSSIFQRLLEALSARKVCVKQNQPYGDILILPGPNYEEDELNV